MPRFIVTLTDQQKADLEVMRRRRGFRSQADVIRQLLIEHALADGLPVQHGQAAIRKAVERINETGQQVADLIVGPVKPAPGSRLKKR